MTRKLFCEISPLTYKISVFKCITIRKIRDLWKKEHFAKRKSEQSLPYLVYSNKSLIRRRLGNVDMTLQENKAQNLSLAVPNVNGIIIEPGETFSFCRLTGNLTQKRGYKEGLIIENGTVSSGIGGGMCQFTNLIHWLILHSPMEITEHHHHDSIDLFPDFNRQIPFGTGTSVMYNYIDYRFKNTTPNTYQLMFWVTHEYLCGELRCSEKQQLKYHISIENEHFKRENGEVYRCGEVIRKQIDTKTGNCINKEIIRKNHAKVFYDTANLKITE